MFLDIKQSYLKILLMTICPLTIIMISPNDTEFAAPISLVVILLSGLTVYNVKNNNLLLIMFSIIFYINLTVSVLGGLTLGKFLPDYQAYLWLSKYNIIYLKSILIVSSVFYLGSLDFRSRYFEVFKRKNYCTNDDLENFFLSHYNPLNSILALCMIIAIMIFAFDGSASGLSDEYVSNTNPLYEYCIFLFAFSWVYGKRSKIIRIFISLVALLYIFNGLITGDRSSSFMLMVLIASYRLKNKIVIKKMLILCILAILLANAIAVYRTDGITSSYLYSLLNRGMLTFFSDTVAHSCYSGLTIAYFSDFYLGNKFSDFLSWIISLFFGSSVLNYMDIKLEEVVFAARSMFDNGGGGLFPAYFYFYGDYVGVLFGSLISMIIIRFVYYHSDLGYCRMLSYILPAMSLRWYLYTPSTLFRACLINFLIIFFFFYFIDVLTLKNKRSILCK